MLFIICIVTGNHVGLETSVAPFGWCVEKKEILLLPFKSKANRYMKLKH
jgi:hypothetical protein